MNNIPEFPKSNIIDDSPASCADAYVKVTGNTPHFGSIRAAAFATYRAPFRYDPSTGFIYDADLKHVSDDGDLVGPYNNLTHITARVRGWSYLQNQHKQRAAAIQDEIGTMIAEALTEFWQTHGA